MFAPKKDFPGPDIAGGVGAWKGQLHKIARARDWLSQKDSCRLTNSATTYQRRIPLNRRREEIRIGRRPIDSFATMVRPIEEWIGVHQSQRAALPVARENLENRRAGFARASPPER